MSRQSSPSVCFADADLTGAGQCVAFNFRRTARALTKAYDAALRSTGLRSTQFSILVGVAKMQPVSVSDLAYALLLDQSTLSRGLHLMRRQQLLVVSRRSAMRQRFVTLSPTGARALSRSVPRWRKTQRRFVADIGDKRWREMRRALERLSRHALRVS